MIDVIVQPVTQDDVINLVNNLREADRLEIEATTDEDVLEAVEQTVESSPQVAMAGYANGELVCIFGVATPFILTDQGTPWCLFTPNVEKYRHLFLRQSKPYVELMLEHYKTLFNFVDCRNTLAIRWLKWLGFKFGEPVPYGVQGLDFYPFVLER